MLFHEPEVRCSHWCCLEYVDGCFHVNMDANSYTQGCHRMPTTVRPRCGSRTTCPFHVSCDAAAACHCMPGSDLILGSQNWVSHRAEGIIWGGNCLQRKENEVRCVRWVWVVWVEDLNFDFDLVLMFLVHWGLESWSLVSNARRFSRFNNLPRAPRKPQLFKLRPKEDVALLCPQYSCLPLDSISTDFDFDSVTAYQICEATPCGKVLDSGASSLLGMNWQR